MKKQLLFILLFLPAFLTAKEIRYFVQPGEILDLSENAFERHGIKVSEIDSVSMSGSFTFSIKVRSHARELGEKALITNKKNNIPNEAGIWIGTQDNGSWIVHFCDGKNTPWEYRPTALRQPINDDKWHTLTVTHDAGKQEMRMYYDQLNVAIYCTNGNVNLATNNTLRIGSVDDGQWNAFNGYIKEFTFISHVELPKISVTDTQRLSQLKVMAFNIFHGGHELGQEVGVNRVVEVIKAENPDVIGMVETYGSGAIIADALGYYFYLRSSNLSIMSRYPITDTYDLYDSFNCSAATLQISSSQQINYINLWLDYRPITTVLGINETEEDYENIYVYEKEGFKIAFLNYTYGTNGIPIPDSKPYIVNMLDKDKITADVTKAKQLADMVIVLPHWGTEYVYTPDSNQNYWTQLFLSLGVDVVIGTHPHVLEPVEVVSDTKGHEMLVYYSLGNFVSNQDQKPRMIGGMAKMTLVKDETGCYVKNYNLTPVITQKLFGQKAITTYKLSDYTESLASGNAIRNDSGCSDFSLSYCQTLVKQILGDDYDESTSELNVSLHPDGLVKDTSATESSSSAK